MGIFSKLKSGIKISGGGLLTGLKFIGNLPKLISYVDTFKQGLQLLEELRNSLKIPACNFFIAGRKKIEEIQELTLKTENKIDDAVINFFLKIFDSAIKLFHLEQEYQELKRLDELTKINK